MKQRKRQRFLALVMFVMFALSNVTPGLAAQVSGLKDISSFKGGNGGGAKGNDETIYFGKYWQNGSGTEAAGYTKEAVRWLVLANNEEVDSAGNQGLFLLSEKALYADAFSNNGSNDRWSNANSDVRKTLSGLATGNQKSSVLPYWEGLSESSFAHDAFNANEFNEINDTTHRAGGTGTGSSSSATDRLFLLSKDEVENALYGFDENAKRIAEATGFAQNVTVYDNPEGKVATNPAAWYLRSPGGSSKVCGVDAAGNVGKLDVADASNAVRPAFNLKTSNVLFASAAVDGKSSSTLGVFGLPNVDPTSENFEGWKLTVISSYIQAPSSVTVSQNVTGGVDNLAQLVEDGGTIDLTQGVDRVADTAPAVSYYANAIKQSDPSKKANFVSAVVADDTGKYVNYVRISDTFKETMKQLDFGNLSDGTYTMYIFAEQANGDKETDYASSFSDAKGYTIYKGTTHFNEDKLSTNFASKNFTALLGGDFHLSFDNGDYNAGVSVKQSENGTITAGANTTSLKGDININSDATLTTEKIFSFDGQVVNKGNLVNNGALWLSKTIDNSGGNVTNNGVLCGNLSKGTLQNNGTWYFDTSTQQNVNATLSQGTIDLAYTNLQITSEGIKPEYGQKTDFANVSMQSLTLDDGVLKIQSNVTNNEADKLAVGSLTLSNNAVLKIQIMNDSCLATATKDVVSTPVAVFTGNTSLKNAKIDATPLWGTRFTPTLSLSEDKKSIMLTGFAFSGMQSDETVTDAQLDNDVPFSKIVVSKKLQQLNDMAGAVLLFAPTGGDRVLKLDENDCIISATATDSLAATQFAGVSLKAISGYPCELTIDGGKAIISASRDTGYAYGIFADKVNVKTNGNGITIDTVKSQNSSAYGLYSSSGTEINCGEINITEVSGGGNTYGASFSGSVNTNGNDITVDTVKLLDASSSTRYAYGVAVTNATLDLTKDGKYGNLTIGSSESDGMIATSNSQQDILYPLDLSGNTGRINCGQINIIGVSNISQMSGKVYSMYVRSDAVVNTNGNDITIEKIFGTGRDIMVAGVVVQNGGKLDLTKDGKYGKLIIGSRNYDKALVATYTDNKSVSAKGIWCVDGNSSIAGDIEINGVFAQSEYTGTSVTAGIHTQGISSPAVTVVDGALTIKGIDGAGPVYSIYNSAQGASLSSSFTAGYTLVDDVPTAPHGKTIQIEGNICSTTNTNMKIALASGISYIKGNLIGAGSNNLLMQDGGKWYPEFSLEAKNDGNNYTSKNEAMVTLSKGTDEDASGGVIDIAYSDFKKKKVVPEGQWDIYERDANDALIPEYNPKTDFAEATVSSLVINDGVLKIQSNLANNTADKLIATALTLGSNAKLKIQVMNDELFATAKGAITNKSAVVLSANIDLSSLKITTEIVTGTYGKFTPVFAVDDSNKNNLLLTGFNYEGDEPEPTPDPSEAAKDPSVTECKIKENTTLTEDWGTLARETDKEGKEKPRTFHVYGEEGGDTKVDGAGEYNGLSFGQTEEGKKDEVAINDITFVNMPNTVTNDGGNVALTNVTFEDCENPITNGEDGTTSLNDVRFTNTKGEADVINEGTVNLAGDIEFDKGVTDDDKKGTINATSDTVITGQGEESTIINTGTLSGNADVTVKDVTLNLGDGQGSVVGAFSLEDVEVTGAEPGDTSETVGSFDVKGSVALANMAIISEGDMTVADDATITGENASIITETLSPVKDMNLEYIKIDVNGDTKLADGATVTGNGVHTSEISSNSLTPLGDLTIDGMKFNVTEKTTAAADAVFTGKNGAVIDTGEFTPDGNFTINDMTMFATTTTAKNGAVFSGNGVDKAFLNTDTLKDTGDLAVKDMTVDVKSAQIDGKFTLDNAVLEGVDKDTTTVTVDSFEEKGDSSLKNMTFKINTGDSGFTVAEGNKLTLADAVMKNMNNEVMSLDVLGKLEAKGGTISSPITLHKDFTISETTNFTGKFTLSPLASEKLNFNFDLDGDEKVDGYTFMKNTYVIDLTKVNVNLFQSDGKSKLTPTGTITLIKSIEPGTYKGAKEVWATTATGIRRCRYGVKEVVLPQLFTVAANYASNANVTANTLDNDAPLLGDENANGITSLMLTYLEQGATDQTKSFTNARLGALAAITGAGDLIASAITDEANPTSGKWEAFASLGGHRTRYDEIGSNVDLNMFNVAAGLSRVVFNNITFGVFAEGGDGRYYTENKFEEGNVLAKGDINYFGGGVFAKYAGKKTALGQLHSEVSFRAGHMNSKYNSDTFNQSSYTSFDMSGSYLGAHAGFGYKWNVSQGNIDTYVKYLWNRQGSTSTVMGGDTINLNAINSHRLRAGFRYNNETDENGFNFFGGLAYEYEFDGKAKGSVGSDVMPTSDFKGGSGLAELGIKFERARCPWKGEVSILGFTGKRDGFGANLSVWYMFGK